MTSHDDLAARVAHVFQQQDEHSAFTERRAGQLEMAVAVAGAIVRREHLVVRAGTGVGKTFAYLVPAMLAGTPVVISTATRSLQEQLASRDLPALCDSVGRPLEWTVLKGRSNYLCRQKLDETVGGLDVGVAVVDELRTILEWADTTTTGDRDELPAEPATETWRQVSVGSNECPGRERCPRGAECFAERARETATGASIVITNHHVYAAGLFASQQILPAHEIAIFDEAHHLDETFRQASATRVDPVGLIHTVRSGHDRADAATEPVVAELTALRAALAPLAGTALASTQELAASGLAAAATLLRDFAKRMRDEARIGGDQRVLRKAHAIGLALENLTLSADDDRLAWVEGSAARPVLRSIGSSPVALRAFDDPSRRVAILTSAAVGPVAACEAGLRNTPVRTLTIPSPFDYARRALLYCAADLPDPRSATWAPAAHARLADLIRAAGGRTLALFTSWRALREAAEHIAPTVDAEIIVQGTVGRRELLRRFRSEPATCAFGTLGLAEGIDIPGAALTLVTLDRLPFPPIADPYLAVRRAAKGRLAFREIDLRHAATLLTQAGGRLMRTTSDRGVFAVLDPRLARARYGGELVRSLPPMRRAGGDRCPDGLSRRVFVCDLCANRRGRDAHDDAERGSPGNVPTGAPERGS